MTGNPLLPQLADVLSPLRILIRTDPTQFGGSDVEELHDAGVPVFGLQQDASSYFDIHHSADDTLDKINRADLDQNVAAWQRCYTSSGTAASISADPSVGEPPRSPVPGARSARHARFCRSPANNIASWSVMAPQSCSAFSIATARR